MKKYKVRYYHKKNTLLGYNTLYPIPQKTLPHAPYFFGVQLPQK